MGSFFLGIEEISWIVLFKTVGVELVTVFVRFICLFWFLLVIVEGLLGIFLFVKFVFFEICMRFCLVEGFFGVDDVGVVVGFGFSWSLVIGGREFSWLFLLVSVVVVMLAGAWFRVSTGSDGLGVCGGFGRLGG